MKTLKDGRWVVLGVVLALGLGCLAGAVSAKGHEPDHDGILVLTPVAEILCQEFKVQVKGDDVFAVRGEDDDEVRLLIQGGKGLIRNGTLSDGDRVTVTGRDKDKRHTHRGHVTVLK